MGVVFFFVLVFRCECSSIWQKKDEPQPLSLGLGMCQSIMLLKS